MIFNGCPKSVAAKHFRSICAEDCVFVSRSINNPFGPNYREVRGVSSMVEYVDAALEAIPDCIFAILDSKFFRKAQNESMIISSYTVNGRMIFTVDTLDTEDVEDIDSAISGLQMLYQGRCGSGNEEEDIDEAAQIICHNVQSAAAIKKEKEEGFPSGQEDSLYSFVYQPSANEAAAAAAMIASTVSTSKPLHASASSDAVRALPMDSLKILSQSADGYTTGGTVSVGVSLANSGNVSPFNGASSAHPSSSSLGLGLAAQGVVPFDYSLKFTSTGASLFEPSSASDEEDEPLESLGINPVMPGAHHGPDGQSVGSGGSGRPSVRELAKIRSNTSTISMLANSSSERINQRMVSGSNSAATTAASSTANAPSAAAHGQSNQGQAQSHSVGLSLHSAPPSSSNLVGLTGEMSSACKEFWQKQRSNVMIVKEEAKFCLKERVPLSKQIYKVKGTLTLHLNAEKKVKRIEMLNSFDTSMHR